MIIGIDPSLTGTGLCYGATTPNFRLFRSKPTTPDVRSRIVRFDNLAREIATAVTELHPAAIYLEGYSLGSHQAGKASTCEFGGLLRFWLTTMTDCDPIEIPPATLKKFFTGRGNAKKHEMFNAALERYNQLIEDDNLVDAFGIWRLGCLDTMPYPNLIDQIEADGFDHYQDKVAEKKK